MDTQGSTNQQQGAGQEDHDSQEQTISPEQQRKDREKLLDRIRKLYAMSRESESSPHEAEIAMRRCQSLMDRFGITEADLETSEFGDVRISVTGHGALTEGA